MNIVVYCSSSNNLDKRIIEIAEATGSTIGKTGCNLLYGGVDAGLMHTTAAAASAAGAKIIGVVPERFKHRADALCNDLRLCIDLNDRKAIMIEHGDIFVVLPGGIGTLDELLSTLSIMKVNNDHRCRIIVANIDGCFDGIIAQLAATAASPFTTGTDFSDAYTVATSTQQLIETLTLMINNYGKK